MGDSFIKPLVAQVKNLRYDEFSGSKPASGRRRAFFLE
jgi:hypothetical protein